MPDGALGGSGIISYLIGFALNDALFGQPPKETYARNDQQRNGYQTEYHGVLHKQVY